MKTFTSFLLFATGLLCVSAWGQATVWKGQHWEGQVLPNGCLQQLVFESSGLKDTIPLCVVFAEGLLCNKLSVASMTLHNLGIVNTDHTGKGGHLRHVGVRANNGILSASSSPLELVEFGQCADSHTTKTVLGGDGGEDFVKVHFVLLSFNCTYYSISIYTMQ